MNVLSLPPLYTSCFSNLFLRHLGCPLYSLRFSKIPRLFTSLMRIEAHLSKDLLVSELLKILNGKLILGDN